MGAPTSHMMQPSARTPFLRPPAIGVSRKSNDDKESITVTGIRIAGGSSLVSPRWHPSASSCIAIALPLGVLGAGISYTPGGHTAYDECR